MINLDYYMCVCEGSNRKSVLSFEEQLDKDLLDYPVVLRDINKMTPEDFAIIEKYKKAGYEVTESIISRAGIHLLEYPWPCLRISVPKQYHTRY